MEKKIKVLPPIMPNFAFIEINGIKQPNPIPVSGFSEQEASDYSDLMKVEFIKHWNKIKRNDR